MENLLKDYRTISDFLTLVILPEIEDRISLGNISSVDLPIEINQFQILWDKKDNKRIVELNGEVNIIVKVRGKRQINAGEAVTTNDIYLDECYLENPKIDGEKCSFFVYKSNFLGFIFYFNFLPNHPDYEEEKHRDLNMKFNILDFINAKEFNRVVRPYDRLRELKDKDWPPAPNIYPKVISDFYSNPDIVNSNLIVDKILEVYTPDYWNRSMSMWEIGNFFPNRLIYLKKAIDSFFTEDYISSIYILVPQFEGIVKDFLINNNIISISDWEFTSFKTCVDKLRELIFSRKIIMFPKEILNIILEDLKYGSFWKNTRNISNPRTQINRHGILHGLFKDFECKEIALKYLLLLDSLTLLILQDKIITHNL